MSSNIPSRSIEPLVCPSAVMSLVSHQQILSIKPSCSASRNQLMCPSSVRSAGTFRSLLDKDLNTDSASTVRVTSILSHPCTRSDLSWLGVSTPWDSSCSVTSVG